MGISLELVFPFSTCFEESGGSLISHNYTLRLSTESLGTVDERRVRALLHERLIVPLHSRDASGADFLKGELLTEERLLLKMVSIAASVLTPRVLKGASLERGDGCRRLWVPDER